ncbi:MAG: murein tripeptide amidase MpaA [Verrucomicrobiota bacterium]
MESLPISQRGDHGYAPESFGQSVLNQTLEVWMPEKKTRLLILAGQHGEEPETTVVLSRALRTLNQRSPDCAVILSANPDGILHGTRGNARGVDLNRNFPSTNWFENKTSYRWNLDRPDQRIKLSPGEHAKSEPETKHLLELVTRLQPQLVISLHAPLACIDDPRLSEQGKRLSLQSGLKLTDNIGYPTPGSFGSWAIENDVHLITFELSRLSIEELSAKFSPLFTDVLTGKLL